MASLRSSPPVTQADAGFLGVGAEVSLRGFDKVVGLVLRSAPGSSWVVYWYDVQKTSCSKFNQLVVESSPSQGCLAEVSVLSKILGSRSVDFANYTSLRSYLGKVKTSLTGLAPTGASKMPAVPSSRRKPSKTVGKKTPVVSPPSVRRAKTTSPQASSPSRFKSRGTIQTSGIRQPPQQLPSLPQKASGLLQHPHMKKRNVASLLDDVLDADEEDGLAGSGKGE